MPKECEHTFNINVLRVKIILNNKKKIKIVKHQNKNENGKWEKNET